ncbi:GH92 family glycosyl hydrolase [Fulvivirgaceae bacterium BMA12]|uniref:GH92 family glycosyl hydrolase n=1 Tax=Agaribacillus aureus TaxID=3051825 RepID=A0ABT8KZF2_9BACT|nr:GH92 family glycosyl hydrolase [Fulvivirgaceae bacterium BMA12]
MQYNLSILVLFCACLFSCTTQSTKSPIEYVNSFIGSTGASESDYGGTIPSVAPPFAMTQWSAMTRENYISSNPYNYKDSSIIGFIGTHQPAIWMGDYGFISFLPSTGKVKISAKDRALKFKHEDEKASPYFYSVQATTENGGQIKTEIASTLRCAIFNISLPPGNENHIFVEASRKISDQKEFVGFIRILPESNEIIGYNSDRHSYMLGPDLPNFKGYFVMQFSKPFTRSGLWEGDQLLEGATEKKGDHIGGYVYFDMGGDEIVQVKMATSFISIEQARQNLSNEIPEWDFDQVVNENKAEWEKYFDRVIVESDDEDQKTCFYTALHRTLQYPRIFSEYGKYYSAFDDTIHVGNSYNDYSLWDTFRAQHPWLTLVAPEHVNPMIQSLLQMYDEGGWMPKWPNPTYSNIMIGTHADAVVADAFVKNFRDYDLDKAYTAVYKNAMTPPDNDTTMRWADREKTKLYEGRGGLTYYKEKGYIPADKTAESVSRTLEFAYDDFCVAQIAKGLGKADDYDYFLKRSKNYRNIYDPETGFMSARNFDGTFVQEIKAKIDEVEQVVEEGITEGGRWTYLFCVMQDVEGLISLTGGREKFISLLDQNFDEGHFQHRNEPGHHFIYLYNYAGEPSKTQEKIWEHTPLNYRNAPDGLSGNDDCGQMSAWLIFSSMGFYPVCPGSGEYVIGSPLYSKIVLNLPEPYHKKVIISAKGVDEGKKYIKSLTLDGKPITKPFISHADIVSCDELVFEMSATPTDWGR